MDKLPYPKAFIFDWDNTLVNTWPAITDALNLTRATYGLKTWTVEEARIKSARALRVSFPEWFGDEWEKARDIFYGRYHDIHAERLEPMEGAESFLQYVKQLEIPAVIVSTKKNVLLRKEVNHMGWSAYFGAIIGSMDAPKDKPDRAPVDMVLAQIGLQADNPFIWFIGDTHADVECALRSGSFPVLVNNIREGERLGLKWSFSDCAALKNALYSRLAV